MLSQVQLIIDYTHFYNSEPPKDRISLLNGLSKKHVLFEIAGLNYRLKPRNQLRYDSTVETQLKELRYFCPIDNELQNRYLTIFHSNINGNKNPIIFNRACNLFAMEEILNSDELVDIDDFVMRKVEVWDSILKYILSVNAEVTKIKPNEIPTFENLTASTVVLNELLIEDNPLFIPYKGIKLLHILLNHNLYGNELKEYFDSIVKIEPDHFIYSIMSLYLGNKQEHVETEFHYTARDDSYKFIDFLSKNRPSNKDTIKLLSIKKAPFYKDSDRKYIVLDINFLINKSYSFLINDFWFDYLKIQKDEKEKPKFNIQDYRGVIGHFFETYVQEILNDSFNHLKHPKPFFFDELKVKISNGTIEFSDVYIRQQKKIIIGEVKSGSIYDNEKYSGEIELLYKNDREKFFDNFGVNQVVESIKTLKKYGPLFDSNLPVDKALEIFPIIIFNDKIFQTPLMSNLFNIRFQELIEKEEFNRLTIHPLVIVHIYDLEYIHYSLANKKVKIWDLLRSHLKGKKMVYPFYNTIIKSKFEKGIMDKVKMSFYPIIEKYRNK
jgi:hypothetical protein